VVAAAIGVEWEEAFVLVELDDDDFSRSTAEEGEQVEDFLFHVELSDTERNE
jgi:hypothetical protein